MNIAQEDIREQLERIERASIVARSKLRKGDAKAALNEVGHARLALVRVIAQLDELIREES